MPDFAPIVIAPVEFFKPQRANVTFVFGIKVLFTRID